MTDRAGDARPGDPQTLEAPRAYVQDVDGRPSPPGYGGKAQWLNRLVRSGFPVPASVVVTTAAYDAVIHQAAIASYLAELARADDGDAIGERAQVDEAFLSIDLPPEMVEELDTAFAQVAGDSGRVAVRSSATAEDLHGGSFAGQYASFLNVERDELARVVRLVWASLWHPSPRWYRAVHDISDESIAMAVIVMPMIEADLAGVGFSVDPDAPAARRIEVVRGLGDQLVSGEVTPEVHQVPRSDPLVGLDADVRRVVELLDAIEDAFGEAQDIEWALCGGELYVLQARPITTAVALDGDGFDSAHRGATWTTAGIAEMLPGQLAPLVWTTNHRLLEEGFRSLYAALGSLPDDVEDRGGFLGRFRGWAALNLDLVEEASGSDAQSEVERQYFGSPPADRPVSSRRSPWSAIERWWRDSVANRAQWAATVSAEVSIRAVQEISESPVDLGPRSFDELLHYRHRLMDLAGRLVAAEVAVASAATAAHRRFELALQRRLGPSLAEEYALRLARARELASDRVEPSSSRAVFCGPTWAELEGRPDDAGPDARPRPEATAAAPGPERVAASPVEAWQQLVAEVRAEPGWSSTRALTGQVVDVRILLLRRLAEDVLTLLDRREQTKRAVLQLGGEVRRVHLELGRRLADDGVLPAPDLVDHLSERELIGTEAMPSALVLSRRQRWLVGGADDPLPRRFTGPPAHPHVANLAGEEYRGWSASAGRCTGRAVVLHVPDPARLSPGDVLVAHTTDTSWGPVFARAGAIVVEEGGPLSHAAIVARELGVPSVMNLPGIVARIEGAEPGVQVTVDGTEGVVVVAGGADP